MNGMEMIYFIAQIKFHKFNGVCVTKLFNILNDTASCMLLNVTKQNFNLKIIFEMNKKIISNSL